MKNRTRNYLILLLFCLAGIAFVMPKKTVQASAANAKAVEGKWIFGNNDRMYFEKTDGTLYKGWLARNGYVYYLHETSGVRVTGWRTIQGKRYFFQRNNGKLVTGWFRVDGKKYYAASNGALRMGWLTDGGSRYFLNSSKKGAMQTGWAKIQGKRYYFYSDGKLAVKTWIDEKHYVNKKGVLDSDAVMKKKDTFRWPLAPQWNRITSTFGYRGEMTVGTSDHDGLDIAANMNTPIYAGRSGMIQTRRYSESAGNYIEINHENGLVSQYMHMTKFAAGIKPGIRVKRGQLIGYVGSTGWSTGPHLHFGVKVNGICCDPLKFVRQP